MVVDRKTDRQTDRKTERQKDRKTDKKTERQTDKVSYRGAPLLKNTTVNSEDAKFLLNFELHFCLLSFK